MNTEYTVINTRTSEQWTALRHDDCSENVTIADNGVELSRERTPTYVSPRVIGQTSLPSVELLDVDVDRSGSCHVLDAEGALYRTEARDEPFTRYECTDLTAREAKPRAFCVAGDAIYVAGTRPNEGDVDRDRGYIQALSAHLRQTRWVVDPTPDVPFSDPIRVVSGRSTSGVYVLDSGHKEGDGFVAHVTDDGTARVVVSGLRRPRDLTVDNQGILFVLDAEDDEEPGGEHETDVWVVRRHSAVTGTSSPVRNRTEDDEVSDDSESEAKRGTEDDEESLERPLADVTCIEAMAEDGFVIGVGSKASGERTLYRYAPAGGSSEKLTRASVETLSSFKRGCTRLRRGGGDGAPLLYAIAIDNEGIWALEPTTAIACRETNEEGSGDEHAAAVRDRRSRRYSGRFVGQFDLDGTEADRGRIHLEYGDVPPGTRVALRYATTDRDLLAGDCDCGCGVGCYCESGDHSTDGWRTVEASTPTDALLHLDGQRFLWLEVELIGSQFASPTVRSLKLSVSHEPYLHSLPTIYRDDESSAVFLEQLLAVFEDTFGDIDHAIGTLTRYFDAESIPSSYLSWLGNWLAVAEDEAWSARSKRRLIAAAPTLFKRRGTRNGLLQLLEIYLDGEEASSVPWESTGTPDDSQTEQELSHFILLLEYSDVVDDMNGADESRIEANTHSLAPFRDLLCCPQEFVVLIGPTVGEDTFRTVERIVESERPAHARGRAVSLRSQGRLGDHVYLGVNSYLPPREFVVDESRLGRDSVVGMRGSESQLGGSLRLGTHAELP